MIFMLLVELRYDLCPMRPPQAMRLHSAFEDEVPGQKAIAGEEDG